MIFTKLQESNAKYRNFFQILFMEKNLLSYFLNFFCKYLALKAIFYYTLYRISLFSAWRFEEAYVPHLHHSFQNGVPKLHLDVGFVHVSQRI